MTNKEQIQKEIEQTLQSLDGVQRATANPFLFTRIKARMQKPASGWERVYTFIARPVVAIAVVVLVMAVNGWAIFNSGNENSNGDNNETATVPVFVNDYQAVASVDNYNYFENSVNQ
jgi:hypothetical protein